MQTNILFFLLCIWTILEHIAEICVNSVCTIKIVSCTVYLFILLFVGPSWHIDKLDLLRHKGNHNIVTLSGREAQKRKKTVKQSKINNYKSRIRTMICSDKLKYKK